MTNQTNIDNYKLIPIIEERLQVWDAIGEKKQMKKCEKLLAGWYTAMNECNPIGKRTKFTIFNSKINSNR